MLYLIGLGLHDENDLSLKAVDVLRNSDRVYFESYTSFFNGDLGRLRELCGKEVVPLKRSDLEEKPEENVLAGGEVALLVAGDPFAATTHADLVLRAWKKGIKVRAIHNSSIHSAVGETGLQLYKFGRTTTIAYPEGKYFPTSPYDVVKENKTRGLHTLCLLDVKAEEGRYMTVNEGIQLLLRMENKQLQNQFKENTPCVGAARLGGDDAAIRYGTAAQLLKENFGGPPHALIIPAKLHPMEKEMLDRFRA